MSGYVYPKMTVRQFRDFLARLPTIPADRASEISYAERKDPSRNYIAYVDIPRLPDDVVTQRYMVPTRIVATEDGIVMLDCFDGTGDEGGWEGDEDYDAVMREDLADLPEDAVVYCYVGMAHKSHPLRDKIFTISSMKAELRMEYTQSQLHEMSDSWSLWVHYQSGNAQQAKHQPVLVEEAVALMKAKHSYDYEERDQD